ncbi:hypothetical protein P8452_73010 [Trifolium repens]|nr:protein TORNADO [Trifolium repens]WJX91198.1 hypothetical protein P8452_73010 [Trifolium repens]
MKFSNSLIGILNFLTLIISIPILVLGIWLTKHAYSECDTWLAKFMISLGVFLLVISLMGFIGASCRVSCILCFYLIVILLLIILLFSFAIFAFVVTNKGAGETLPNKGYKEYRLGYYSNWLQNRVNNNNNWNTVKSCLQSQYLCSNFHYQFAKDTVDQFYTEHLSPLQSGCCKPSNDCSFTYQNPTTWTKTRNVTYTNPDCDAWANDPNVLCFDCQSCKAGLLQTLQNVWKKVSDVNFIILIFLVIMCSIGCCAFRNNRRYF